jgi:hypothetical protein
MFVQYSATGMYGFDAMARRVAKHFSSSRHGVVMDSLIIGVAIIEVRLVCGTTSRPTPDRR